MDEFGDAFSFVGKRTEDCALRRSTGGEPHTTVEVVDIGAPHGGHGSGDGGCGNSFCDPEPDPLRAAGDSARDREIVDPGAPSIEMNPCAVGFCDPGETMLRASSKTDRELVDLGGLHVDPFQYDPTIVCDALRALTDDDIRVLVELDMIHAAAGGFEYCRRKVDGSDLSAPTAVMLGDIHGTAMNPCAMAPCDPNDPLGGSISERATSPLSGYSFQLTLGTGKRVVEHCWTFHSDGIVATQHGTSLAWSPKPDSGFQLVGVGGEAQGMAYHGALEGNLLRVSGIEARDGKSMVINGWGQVVTGCEILE